MASTMLDLRRTDERSTALPNPYWMSSAEIGLSADDKEAVFFSFPTSKGHTTLVMDAVFETGTAFTAAGSVDLLVGIGTIPLETTTTGGTVSVVDADEIFATGDITLTANAISHLSGGDMYTAVGLAVGGVIITHVDASVPVIYATLTRTGAIVAGQGRLHLLMTTVPLVLNA